MPINGVVILTPEGNMKIQSDMLQDGGVQDVQGTQYRAYNGKPMDAGQDLCLTLTGRPGSGSPVLGSGSSRAWSSAWASLAWPWSWQAPGCIHGPDRGAAGDEPEEAGHEQDF